MSFMHASPEALKAAASDLAGIGSEISSANVAASLPTTGLVAAAGDQVSAQVAALFSSHAAGYQQLSNQMSSFHEKFVQALGLSANAYGNTEQNAAKTLSNAVNSPVQQLLGGEPVKGPAGLAQAAAKAVTQARSAFEGAGAKALSMLGLTPTGGTGLLAAPRGLLGSAEATAASILPVSWATAIQNFYLFAEPYVQYGFELAQYAVGWIPYIGILAGQIPIFYDLFEPIVQSLVFNTTDWLSGAITFGQSWSSFWGATAASVNQFINNEIYWFLSFFPPLPPLP